MIRRSVLTLAAATLVLGSLLVAAPAGAVVETTYNGVLDDTDPTLNVAFISTPVCTGLGSTPVHYDVIEFPDAIGGTYTILETTSTVNIGVYVLEGSFDPLDVFATCVAASNTNPIDLTYDFVEGTDYYVVVFDDTFDQAGGDWEVEITSPDPPPTTTTSTTSTSTTSTTTPESTTTTSAAPVAAAVTTPRFTG
jgi:hypothetical protein